MKCYCASCFLSFIFCFVPAFTNPSEFDHCINFNFTDPILKYHSIMCNNNLIRCSCNFTNKFGMVTTVNSLLLKCVGLHCSKSLLTF